MITDFTDLISNLVIERYRGEAVCYLVIPMSLQCTLAVWYSRNTAYCTNILFNYKSIGVSHELEY